MSYKDTYGPNVAVIGASNDRTRYSNKAVRAFRSEGYNVYPVNPKETLIEGIKAYHSVLEIPDRIDFATVYVNPQISIASRLPDQLRDKNIEMVILNPGAESDELVRILKSHNIKVQMVCSLIALGKDPEEF